MRMKVKKILLELEEIARQLGFEIRKGKGNFRGGRCTIGGQETIVLNKHHSPEVHLSLLAECLKDSSLDAVAIKPAVRKALEEVWDAQSAMLAEDVDAE